MTTPRQTVNEIMEALAIAVMMTTLKEKKTYRYELVWLSLLSYIATQNNNIFSSTTIFYQHWSLLGP